MITLIREDLLNPVNYNIKNVEVTTMESESIGLIYTSGTCIETQDASEISGITLTNVAAEVILFKESGA